MSVEEFILADIGLSIVAFAAQMFCAPFLIEWGTGGRTTRGGNAWAGLLAAVAVNVLMWAVVWPTVN